MVFKGFNISHLSILVTHKVPTTQHLGTQDKVSSTNIRGNVELCSKSDYMNNVICIASER